MRGHRPLAAKEASWGAGAPGAQLGQNFEAKRRSVRPVKTPHARGRLAPTQASTQALFENAGLCVLCLKAKTAITPELSVLSSP